MFGPKRNSAEELNSFYGDHSIGIGLAQLEFLWDPHARPAQDHNLAAI